MEKSLTMGRPRPVRGNLVPALLAVMLAAGLAACADPPENEAAVATTSVTVADNTSGPVHIEVAAGTEVTWTWTGKQSHDLVGPGFESEVQREGEFSYTFTEPGVHSYACTIHGGMTGAVTVLD